MHKAKNVYDSNIQAGLEFNKRIVEYKGKEQGLRAAALRVNTVHGIVQKKSMKEIEVRQGLE